jgi:uncharacterized protein YecT (DUF1311 family)
MAVNGLIISGLRPHLGLRRRRWGGTRARRAIEEEKAMPDTITLRLAAAVSTGALVALIAMAAASRPAASQEFDCRNANYASERAVCGSERLSALDERMNALYGDLRAVSGNRYARADLKDYQRQFLDARNACGRDAECINGAYLDQISVLESRLGRAYRRSER